MATIFSINQEQYCDKICNYILSKEFDPKVLTVLYQLELNSTLSKIKVETKDIKLAKTLKLNLRTAKAGVFTSTTDLLDLAIKGKNWGAFLWVLNQNYPLTRKQLVSLTEQIPVQKDIALPLKLEILQVLVNRYVVSEGIKFENLPDEVPVSYPYAIAFYANTSSPDNDHNEEIEKEIVEKYIPFSFSDLRTLKKRSSMKLVLEKHGDKFPLVGNILKYEKKVPILSGEMVKSPNNRNSHVYELLNELVAHDKLTEALEKCFGLSSKKFVKIFEEKFFNRSEQLAKLDLDYLVLTEFLSDIFLDVENHADFLHFQENSDSLKYLVPSIVPNTDRYNLVDLLNDNFTNEQIVQLLKASKRLPDLSTALRSYKSYQTYFQRLFEATEFKNMATLDAIIKLIFDHEDIASVELVRFNQENYSPETKQLKEVTLPGQYTIKLAESNHELINWGVRMDHCIGGEEYQEDAANNDVLLFALVKDNSPKFAVEVRDGRFVQMQGSSGSKPNRETEVALLKTLELLKLIRRD